MDQVVVLVNEAQRIIVVKELKPQITLFQNVYLTDAPDSNFYVRQAGAWYKIENVQPAVSQFLALGDEVSDMETGQLFYWELPLTITNIRGFTITLTSAPDDAAISFDVTKNGVSVFDTVPTIDAGETSTLTAAIPQVVTDGSVTFTAGDVLIVTCNVDAPTTKPIGPKMGLICIS